ncbi:MAG: S-malonyltransferase [Bacteroidota bacterium]|jgi:[acyl-carrier-protein] S-malonyltransferase|nr:ACP S-malonyltransferase [Bacteroidota bacterium]
MKHAFVFPGQGSQFPGMGKAIVEQSEAAKKLVEEANAQLGFDLAAIMFSGTEEELRRTDVTQPAIFLHSMLAYSTLNNPQPSMVAGHSLGEFSALVAAGVLSFADGLRLVAARANAMQKACELEPGTMAAVLGLDDQKVEAVCSGITDIVVPANYNCPGQLVISGSVAGIEKACVALKEAGAKRALVLPVGGAFHSPLMKAAEEELQGAIQSITFNAPSCPVYQNVVAMPVTDPATIKQNLINQLTGPVKWTQSVQAMIADGATEFTEVGPGKVLQGLIQKIQKEVSVNGVS